VPRHVRAGVFVMIVAIITFNGGRWGTCGAFGLITPLELVGERRREPQAEQRRAQAAALATSSGRARPHELAHLAAY
jgi:hypothetical protein